MPTSPPLLDLYAVRVPLPQRLLRAGGWLAVAGMLWLAALLFVGLPPGPRPDWHPPYEGCEEYWADGKLYAPTDEIQDRCAPWGPPLRGTDWGEVAWKWEDEHLHQVDGWQDRRRNWHRLRALRVQALPWLGLASVLLLWTAILDLIRTRPVRVLVRESGVRIGDVYVPSVDLVGCTVDGRHLVLHGKSRVRSPPLEHTPEDLTWLARQIDSIATSAQTG